MSCGAVWRSSISRSRACPFPRSLGCWATRDRPPSTMHSDAGLVTRRPWPEKGRCACIKARQRIKSADECPTRLAKNAEDWHVRTGRSARYRLPDFRKARHDARAEDLMTPESWRFSSAAHEAAMRESQSLMTPTQRSRLHCRREPTPGVSIPPRRKFSFGWTVRSRSVSPRCADMVKTIPTSFCGSRHRAGRSVARAVRPGREALFAPALGRGSGTSELEINDLERRAIERSLAERRSRLIEKTEDTTLTTAPRRAALRELSAIAAALRKLRRRIRCGA